MSSHAATGPAHARRPLSVPAPQLRPAPLEAPGTDKLTPMTLTWGVARRALGELAPAGPSELVHINLSIDPADPDARAAWSVRDPRSGHTTDLALDTDAPTQCTAADGCLLIRGPHIYAFIRTTTATPELLYARTTIFQSLNIPGGRYQVIGAEVC